MLMKLQQTTFEDLVNITGTLFLCPNLTIHHIFFLEPVWYQQ